MGDPFQIPGHFNLYDSYTTDPYYAKLLTAGWAGLVGVFIVKNAPNLYRDYVRRPSTSRDGWMLRESVYNSIGDIPTRVSEKSGNSKRSQRQTLVNGNLASRVKSATQFLGSPIRLPNFRKHRQKNYTRLTIGQYTVLLCIPAIILATLLPQQQLYTNSNRLSFLAVASFVPLFLSSVKSFSPLSILAGQSYVSANFVHRWIGRAIFILALAHGALWLAQYARFGQLQQQLDTAKVQEGIVALAFLFFLNVSSLGWFRRRFYTLFFAAHVVGFIGVLITVNIHTPYALPWIVYGVVTVYSIDLGTRFLLRMNIVMATITPLGDGLTQVWVHHLNAGWQAGQHVQVRLFHQPQLHSSSLWSRFTSAFRSFEAHPYTIAAAPLPRLGGNGNSGGFPLYVKSVGPGTWSDGIQSIAPGTNLWACVEGPYGSSPASAIAFDHESLVLFCGGSGATWALSVLEQVINLCSQGDAKLRRCNVHWCVSKQASFHWFADQWDDLIKRGQQNGLEFQVFVNVTGLEETLRPISTLCKINQRNGSSGRPNLAQTLDSIIKDATNPCDVCKVCTCARNPDNEGCCPADADACCSADASNYLSVIDKAGEMDDIVIQQKSCCTSSSEKVQSRKAASENKGCCGNCKSGDSRVEARPEPTLILDGGLAVGVCGPASMIADVQVAVASLTAKTRQRIGGVNLYTETFHL